MRALHFAFLLVDEGKNLVKEFLAILAEELVVGHGDSKAVLRRAQEVAQIRVLRVPRVF
jgi:hypothetical protein